MSSDIKALERNFNIYLKPRFMEACSGYDYYIPEVRHLFSFKPRYKTLKDGSLYLDEDRCTVVCPPDLYSKKQFYSLSENVRADLLLKLEN